ncbi:MAG: hypothetical protein KIT35_09370 [Piscinibacter sp.]|uniref:hypothetical protein n=1 Tax=Piscinibacter sp. TaxID=1903157 RepID=UPI002589A3C3|nr:hypothetical protein [Piscinibacter sp.]MCW5664031.1 hypothetical protein [Piscinibacter sp.]
MTPDTDPARAALEALLDVAGENKAREILAEIGRPAALAELERVAALRLAMRLREAKLPRTVIRERLALRGISRSAAYRLIARAIDVPIANCPSNGPALGREPDILGEPADLVADPQPQPQEIAVIPELATEHTATALRVEVTALRAPWPAGAVIGSIVEIPGDTLPGSLVGKCQPAGPDAAVTHRYEPPRPQIPEPLAAVDLSDIVGSTGNVEFLIARRDELRARLAAIDLPAARKALERARADAAESPGDVAPASPPGAGEMPEQTERRLRYERAAQAYKAAKARIPQLEAEERELRSEVAYVEGLLAAEKQVDEAKAAAESADAELARLSEAADAADAAVRRIVDLIADEERAYAKDRDAAGARVLEAVKAGGSVPVKAASRDKIATLEVAKAGAEREQQAARAAHQQAAQRRREAWRCVRVAEASVAERAFRQAERDFVEALTRVMAAKAVAGDRFGAADPRGEAIARSRRIVESLGL